jgi:hypothetical protein
VLRVPPGWGARVRGWIEEDGRCNAQEGAPALVVEESPWVFLPVKIAGESWPRAESWAHAFVLLGVAGTSGAVMVPRTLPDLVGWLSRGDAGGGRRPFAPECAQLLAWDLLCAAVAWERARAAWWLARHARGHRSERAASEWQHQAAEWGIRILPPHVNHSVACAYAGGLAVRLGLGQLGAHAADLAEVVAKERANAGAFHSRLDFASRVARAGGAPRAVAAVMLSDALAELPVGVTALLHEVFPREVFLHEMPLREVLSLEVPAARHANTSPRSRAKGGPWPYLPFTVIAHDPGPPALRSASGALPRTAAECRGSS